MKTEILWEGEIISHIPPSQNHSQKISKKHLYFPQNAWEKPIGSISESLFSLHITKMVNGGNIDLRGSHSPRLQLTAKEGKPEMPASFIHLQI